MPHIHPTNAPITGIEHYTRDPHTMQPLLHHASEPAVSYEGRSAYWMHMGRFHRLDGPAWITPGHHTPHQWYIDNTPYTDAAAFIAARDAWIHAHAGSQHAAVSMHRALQDMPGTLPGDIPPAPTITHPDILLRIHHISDPAPVMIEATLDGVPCTLRARGIRWSVGIGKDTNELPHYALAKDRWNTQGGYGDSAYDASYMPIDIAIDILVRSICTYLASIGQPGMPTVIMDVDPEA